MSLIKSLKVMPPAGKFIVALLLCGIIFGGVWSYKKYMPKSIKKSSLVAVNDLPSIKYDANANATFHQFPDTVNLTDNGAPMIRCEIMGWNAQAGLAAANGGPKTTKGSIMDENGVNLNLICQNDCSKQGADLLAFAVDYAAGNKHSSKGCQMIIWMGDGFPGYSYGLDDQIKKQCGADYVATGFDVVGSSYGEDKFIVANANIKGDSQNLLKGSFIAGVIMDGDWNIAMQYCNTNQIKVNNDLSTFDLDAVNWKGEDDYLKAAQDYISKVKETRAIVKNGKRTGKDTTLMINGCVSWFPGDKNAFTGRGGVTLASTKDYGAQMPCLVIAPKKWLEDNKSYVEKFILAASQGCDQVKSHSTWLDFACQVQNAVYADKSMSSNDWKKAFIGYNVSDDNGNMNEVGGSRVWNINDAASYFGFGGGDGVDKYQAVYTTFGDVDVKSYPEKIPTYPKYDSVVDLTYMMDVWNKNKSTSGVASAPVFKEGATMSQKVADASYAIEFDINSATIKSASYDILKSIKNNALISENLLIEVTGHTDNTGNDAQNKSLSEARAQSVANWLIQNGIKSARIKYSGVGSDEPLKGVDPNTKDGRAKNRRVEIIFGRQ